MIIKNLALKNFRKFKDVIIDFPDGVTAVVGLNGVGKSTIFEAIAWVLYGSVAARTSADQIKRQGASHNDPCRVELEFVFEENNFRIVREISGKYLSTSATATVNGKIAATGAEVVSKFIQKKLGIDFKSFFTSIFAKQKELNALSSMIASERKPLILKMLGIDSLDDIIKDIKSDKKEKDMLIERLNQNLVDENGNKKIDIYKEKINDFEKQKKNIDQEKTKLIKIIKNSKNELKDVENKYIKYKNEYETVNHKKEILIDKKTLFENKIKFKDEIKNIKEKIAKRKNKIKKEKEKQKFFKNFEKDIKNVDKRVIDIEKYIEKNVKIIEQKKTLRERISKDIIDLDSKSKNINKLGPEAKCPTCERVLSDQYDVLLLKFRKEKDKFEEQIKLYSNEIKNVQDEREKFTRELQALQKKRNYLQTQLMNKERIDTTINNILNEIKQEISEIEKKEKEIKKIGEVIFSLKEFNNIKKQVEVLYKKYQSYLEIFSNKKDNVSSLNLNLEKKESEKRLLSQNIKNLKENFLQIEEFNKQLKQEKKTVYYIKILNEVMNSFRTHLISKIRPTLSSYSSDYFERLTEGKYSELELDDNYNLLVYDEGEAFKIERFSGGEEDLANLCLRLAISEVITERAGGIFNFIILDEIFGSQDMYRRQNIMKALNSLSSKFRQIFLITHIDDIKNYVENIIYVNEKENGVSTIKLE